MMVVNRMVSGDWQEHQDFGWLLGVGRFFWPMENQEIGSSTRNYDGRCYLEVVVANGRAVYQKTQGFVIFKSLEFWASTISKNIEI